MKKIMLLAAALALSSPLVHARGPEWVETGDAGSLPGSAQIVDASPTGEIHKIKGTLAGLNGNDAFGAGDFEDMYYICINEPSQFCILTSLDSGGSAAFDTQLWVFDSTGHAVMGNDNAQPWDTGSAIYQFATDGTRAGIYAPGLYYICISGAGNRPTGDGGQLYNFLVPTEISGPDGPGGGSPVTGWGAAGETGEYSIVMNGVCPVPGPGGLAIALIAGIMGVRPRRR